MGDETQQDYDRYIKELTDLLGEALDDFEEGRVVSSDEFKEILKQKKIETYRTKRESGIK